MLTQARADSLSEVLTTDKERAKTFLTLDLSEALSQINALGYDFTTEELNEYGEMVRSAAQQAGELDVDALDDVAGGVISAVVAVAIIGGAGLVGGGVGAVVGGIEKGKITW